MDPDDLYTTSLVANMATAAVMYLLSSPLLAALLGTLGLVVLIGAPLAERPTPRPESVPAEPG